MRDESAEEVIWRKQNPRYGIKIEISFKEIRFTFDG